MRVTKMRVGGRKVAVHRACGVAAGLLWLVPSASSTRAAEAVAPPVMYPATLWQGRGEAVIRVLNRMDSHVETLTVPVDGAADFKTLHIAVHRCLDRPPTLPADAAVLATVTDQTDDGRKFDGWLLAQEPALSVFTSPLYQVRLVACGGDARDPAVPPLPAAQVPQIVAAQPSGAQNQVGDSGDLSGQAGTIEMAPSSSASPSPASQPTAAAPPSQATGAAGGSAPAPAPSSVPVSAPSSASATSAPRATVLTPPPAPQPKPPSAPRAASPSPGHGPLSLVPPADDTPQDQTPSGNAGDPPSQALPPPQPLPGGG